MQKLLILFLLVLAVEASYAQHQTCAGSLQEYWVNGAQGSVYNWNVLKSGGKIISGVGTDKVSIQWDASVGTDTVTVQETTVAGCLGNVARLPVVRTQPQAEIISKPQTLCDANAGIEIEIKVKSGFPAVLVLQNGDKKDTLRNITSEKVIIPAKPLLTSTQVKILSLTDKNGCSIQSEAGVLIGVLPRPSKLEIIPEK
jgi:hypothetical protein